MAERACRVLLVEDEYLVAILVEDMLGDLGHVLAASAGRLEEALALLETAAFDVALLDLALGGAASYPVAHRLAARGIPFAFVTGRLSDDIDPAYAAAPVLQKPFGRRDLAAIIGKLLQSGEV